MKKLKTMNRYGCRMVVLLSVCLFSRPAFGQFTIDQYDIWVYNPRTGSNIKWATLNGTGEFNPAWSPNGKLMAFDVVSGASQTIAVSNGSSTFFFPSPVFDLANNPSWHPSGNTLLFDQDYSVYTTDLSGSYKTLLIPDAYDAQYGHRNGSGPSIVFTRASTGEIHIFNTSTGIVSPVIATGENARFSPNDRSLVYVFNGDIYRIRLNGAYRPIGSPIAVTHTPASDEGRPDWISQNEIVFHADYGGGGLASYDLYTIRTMGAHASAIRLTGFPASGDFDPAYALSNGKIAYAGDGSSAALHILLPGNDPHLMAIQDGEIFVFPNPATNVLQVRLNVALPGSYNLAVVDLLGRVCLQREVALHAGQQSFPIELDEKQFLPGTYLLQLRHEHQYFSIKWIKI